MINRIIFFSFISMTLLGAADEAVANRTRSKANQPKYSELENALRYAKKCIGVRHERESLAKQLIEQGAFEELAPESKRRAMVFAVTCCSLDMVQFMQKHCSSFDVILKDGYNPLHGAVLGDIEVLEYFLKQRKYDVNAKDMTLGGKEKPVGRTPLHYVLRTAEGAVNKSMKNRGDEKKHEYAKPAEVCKKIALLASFGADLNMLDDTWKKTILHWSCNNDISVMQTILTLKADPNKRDKQRNTPLNYLLKIAPKKDDLTAYELDELMEKVHLLLNHRADVDLKDRKGISPYHRIARMASVHEHFNELNKLIEPFHDLNTEDIRMKEATVQKVMHQKNKNRK